MPQCFLWCGFYYLAIMFSVCLLALTAEVEGSGTTVSANFAHQFMICCSLSTFKLEEIIGKRQRKTASLYLIKSSSKFSTGLRFILLTNIFNTAANITLQGIVSPLQISIVWGTSKFSYFIFCHKNQSQNTEIFNGLKV